MRGDAISTANNIAAHVLLFRLGIVSDLFCGTILIFLVLALYRLLKGVDQNLAVQMVILGGLLPATIDFLNVLNDAARKSAPPGDAVGRPRETDDDSARKEFDGAGEAYPTGIGRMFHYFHR